MKNPAPLVLIALLLSGCGQKENPNSPPDRVQSNVQIEKKDYSQEGIAYLNQGNVASAVQSLNRAIAQNPQDPKPYMILAEVYLRLQNYELAIKNLNQVIALQPDNGPAYYFLGVCQGLSGDRAAGIKNVEHSVTIFQQKKDEENFKKAIITLQQMSESQDKTKE